jgi:diguanylate cyclase (GGDEF)-like protein
MKSRRRNCMCPPRRLAPSVQAAIRHKNALRAAGEQFASVLNNAANGIEVVDGAGRLAVCNRRFREIYRLSLKQTRPGQPAAGILDHRLAQGSMPAMPAAEYLARAAASARSLKPVDFIDELADGRTILLHYEPLPNGRYIATHEDISDQRRAETNAAFSAHHDALTGLPNRALFDDRVTKALDLAARGKGCAVLCLDLDGVKETNDRLGHKVGDRLLQAAAKRLVSCVRKIDSVARLGGDGFAILQLVTDRADDAAFLAARIVDAFAKPFEIDTHVIEIAVSVGVALAPGDGRSAAMMLKDADVALYLAKTEGSGMVRFFEPEIDARIHGRRVLVEDLRDALSKQQFRLYYQPQVNLAEGKVSGFEALLRWQHPTRGLLAPAEFMELAEETGLIVDIGAWVLRAACVEAADWPSDIKVAINLSAVQFSDGDLFASVTQALALSGLPASRLELEITESVLLLDSAATQDVMNRMRALGISVALDDFGAGFSSLNYLLNFPFDKLKIDRAFVRDLHNKVNAMSIIHAVLALSKSLCMKTTAEGVETIEQLDMLREEKCMEIQGYLLSKPRPAAEIPGMIETLNTRYQELSATSGETF